MCTENVGLPILFTWSDWLRYNTFQHLGVASQLVLSPESLSYKPHQSPLAAAAASSGNGAQGHGEYLLVPICLVVRVQDVLSDCY